MVDNQWGTLTNLRIAETLTTSVEPITPPSRKPKARENPGKTILATQATATAVMNTTIKAKLRIIRLHFQISFSEIAQESA